ncbi:efflux RND transporter periplasmic adaptor subunit [Cohnella hashimotonis]|uniref:Efflux RND transporter periplasmic adaptor subunit n=1 Tax=Cohnella hashimotonis TaxID=2826895 RepID=A0ABT6TDJ4_9BACL|nr:efflux RND transporter periplasmic adaptor subunit [Cohnella hashimotonis]MDI4644898.1 efflux RND transporter periplasmic adaptor subunit [Cohnella hashimotonis]
MRKSRKWVAWIVIVCLIAAGGGGYWWYTSKDTKAATNGPSFTQSRVTKGTITKSVSGSGAVEVSESETVKPSESATVEKVKVTEGQTVKKGAVLATFEGEDVSLSLSKSELSLEQLQMQLEQAQEKWKSLQISSAEQADIESAEMNIKSIQLNIKQTKLDMQDTQEKAKAPDPIVASIDGTVTAVNIKDGDTVNGQIEAFTIVNYDKLDIQISADELDISQLKLGQAANITMDALSGQTFTGKVTKIAKEGTSTNGVATFPVTVSLDKTDGVMPGMNGSVDVVIESKQDALLVSVEAVTQMGTKYFVRVPADGTTTGQAAGGQSVGGQSAGGQAAGGQAQGGQAAGGQSAGGQAQGGQSQGGQAQGGQAQGGQAQGGQAQGGQVQSGQSQGGNQSSGGQAAAGDQAADGQAAGGVMPEGAPRFDGAAPGGNGAGAQSGQGRQGGYGGAGRQGGYGAAGGFTRGAQGQTAAGAASTNFTLKEITVGITTDSQVEVLTGLTEGQTVLIPVVVSTGSGNQQQTGFSLGGGFGAGGGAFPAGGGNFGGGNFGGNAGNRTGGTGARTGTGTAGGR